jgi:membrane protease subunit HflK
MTESPWGKKSGSGNKSGGNKALDELLKDGQLKFQNIFAQSGHGGGSGGDNGGAPHPLFSSPKTVIIAVIAAALAMWLASGFFIVNEDEQAVVMRFGRFVRTAEAGPNYHLPSPIEVRIKQPVTRIQREELGFRSVPSFSGTEKSVREVPDESLMLTGDENIIDIHFVVQWHIRDIVQYSFNLLQPHETVKSVAESAMREVIGKTELSDALTGGRAAIESSTALLIQEILNGYGAGIEIVSLQMLKVDPPTSEVISAFRDVQTAEQDKEKAINNARGYRNKILPEARGEAAKNIEKAEGYKQALVERSLGETSRFTSVYNEYKMAKEVTKRRLYLETMEELLEKGDYGYKKWRCRSLFCATCIFQ